MKKILLVILFSFIISSISFGDIDVTVEEYIKDIESGEFSEEDLNIYIESYTESPVYESLGMFLTARVLLYKYDYKSAYEKLEEALNLLDREDNKRLRLEILYYLSEMDMYFYNISSALTNSLEAKSLAEELEITKRIVSADYIIANVYVYTYDVKEAFKYSDEALELSKMIDYSYGVSQYFSLIGIIDYYDMNYESAYINYVKAKEALEPKIYGYIIDDPYLGLEINISDMLYETGEVEEAIEIVENLLKEADSKDSYQLYILNYFLGYFHSEIDIEKSLTYYTEALKKYDESSIIENSYPYRLDLEVELANLNYELGNYEEAANYFYNVSSYEDEGSDEKITAVLESLDEFKFSNINEKLSLLEQLNVSKDEQVKLSRKLLLISIGSILVLLIAGMFIIIEIKAKIKTEKELYITSTTDSLTKTFNRGKIIEIFEKNLKEENAVILLDLDDFKDVNDTFGHLVGDEVLVKVSQIIKDSIRENDSLGRYGGEEFLVILKDTTEEELNSISERIRNNIETYEWFKEGLKTTASIGITRCFSSDAEEVLHRVDTLMYKAKKNGKNQIAFS